MEKFDLDYFHKQLQSSKIGRKFVYVDITGSTMDDARRLGHEVKEYPHGTIVMSERQTKARGARDHKWDATNTGNIYVSIVLHMPPFCRTFEGRFDLEVAACLAVLHVVRQFGVSKVIPKWPNDLWVRGHKLAGFLLEDGRFDIPGTTDSLFILGMGINVNADVRRSSDLQSIATSMVCERDGQFVDREKFLADVCLQLEQTLANKKEDNYRMFLQENLFQEDCVISVSSNMGEVFDGKFVTICKNWDVKFVDTLTGKIMQGSSAVYTVRPKVVNKITVVFTSIHNTNLSSAVSKWLTSVIDTSKYVVCSVPESTITSTDEWMKKCSLLVLVEDVINSELFTTNVGLYLRSGGSVMAFGKGASYLASSILDIHAEEVVLESSHDSVVVLPLLTETSPLEPIINGSVATTADGSLPVIHSLSISDSGFTSKPESVEAVGTVRHQSQAVTFPINPPCFSFSVSEPSTSGQSTDDQNELHLENKPFRRSLEPSNVSCHDLQMIGYVYSSDHEKKLLVFTGNVISGGLVALWGFNVVTNVLEANGLSAEEINHVTEDRFHRDVFLQQVLELLLKS
ncbi:hypothetical protein BsWGS_07914 [Bradybaena similaris]